MFFRAKKWLWTKFTEGRGSDKAYAKYLANLNRVQANADGALKKNECKSHDQSSVYSGVERH
ncbi:MAG: hypothetical protein ACI8PW_002017 [Methylophilaceae bacterium]|jgi:hypothetical protein